MLPPAPKRRSRFKLERRPAAGSERSATAARYFRGITLIQFMFILVFVGIAAFWIVEYFRGRVG